MNKENIYSLPNDIPIPKDDGMCKHLEGMEIPDISLLTSNGDFIKVKRNESFRIVFYCYPMTGRPDRNLPENWNNIPGASGCTIQNISFNNQYEELIKLNAIPIGITTQSIEDIKEMTERLKINYDILSDYKLEFTTLLKLPTFKIYERIFIKRLTLVVSNNRINKVFYPIFPPNNHIKEVLEWLKNEK
tara:strand:+ start:217 stop:783 length:567 start_codon:yes stop_codon:yes gene_type:complete